jgi:hypothetical protein
MLGRTKPCGGTSNGSHTTDIMISAVAGMMASSKLSSDGLAWIVHTFFDEFAAVAPCLTFFTPQTHNLDAKFYWLIG